MADERRPEDGLNKAMLIGRIGQKPDLRTTQNNRSVLKFSLATTETYQDANGAQQSVTHWHNIVLWGKRGEGLAKILDRGWRVYVEGRIETRSYEDKNQVKKYVTEIACTNLIVLGAPRNAGAHDDHAAPGPGAGGGAPRAAGGGSGGGHSGGGYGAPKPSGGGAPKPSGGGGGGAMDDFPPDDFGGGGGNDDDIPF